jgi:DNA-binding MarR family transcriptional regulator
MSRRSPLTPATPEASALALERQLCFALYAASLAMTKAYKPMLDPLRLTYPQYLVMLVLWQHDGLTVSALGERLTLDSGTLTPVLKRLETQGLLHRLRDAADERRVLLQLTAQGRRLREQAAAIPSQMLQASGCAADELADLARRLHDLRQHLQRQLPATAVTPLRHRLAKPTT